MSHYRERVASPQAWRRLRKQMRNEELRDIATDIMNVIIADVSSVAKLDNDTIHNLTGTIEFALSGKNWEK